MDSFQKMYYHALARILGGHQVWTNLSHADLIRDVLVPFVNRQRVPVGYSRTRAIMNLGMVTYLRIFRTPDPIAHEVDAIQLLSADDFAPFECTEELLNGARLEYAWQESRSVLQATLAPKIKRVFVVMAFGHRQLDEMYRNVIRTVANDFGYEVLRSDEIENSENITAELLTQIARSELVLCELSQERPNCYYETGFAHALGRELILVIRRDDKKHFDLASHRFIEWSDPGELATGLRSRFEAIRQRDTRELKDAQEQPRTNEHLG